MNQTALDKFISESINKSPVELKPLTKETATVVLTMMLGFKEGCIVSQRGQIALTLYLNSIGLDYPMNTQEVAALLNYLDNLDKEHSSN